MLSPPRSRTLTKTNEDRDIERILHLINQSTPTHPAKLCDLGDQGQIVRAYRSAGSGNRKIHYDFCVDVLRPDGTVHSGLRVEHKGAVDNKPVDPSRRLGVQFHNGSPKLAIIRDYLTAWYTYWMASGRLAETYGITSPLPSLEEWIKRDAMVQGDPKTPYGVELKRRVRERNGPACSLTAERDEFVTSGVFRSDTIPPENLEELRRHVLATANACLQEKDLWLQVAGNVHGNDDDYHHLWTPKYPLIENMTLVSVEIKKNVEFVFECAGGMKIGGIMRWGKGQGFSNFRFDLK